MTGQDAMSEETKQIQILHAPTEAEPFLVVDKPEGLPSAPLHEGENSALTQAMVLFPEIAAVLGRKTVEKGLVHRIDTATRGCVLIAATQSAYDFFLRAQEEGAFTKWYSAKVDYVPKLFKMVGGFSFPPIETSDITPGKTIVVESRFRAYGKHHVGVRPVTEESGRAALKKSGDKCYRTEITLKDKDIAVCRITAGYRHQVRCHLAWIGLPVKNDFLYNPLCNGNFSEKLCFTAYKIAFPNPSDGSLVTISLET